MQLTRDKCADLCDELGDLLLQPVYHAQMAAGSGHFTFEDVVEAVCRKMIRRHPHVFGDEGDARQARGQGLLGGHQGQGSKGRGADAHCSTACPLALPALTRAAEIAGQGGQGRL